VNQDTVEKREGNIKYVRDPSVDIGESVLSWRNQGTAFRTIRKSKESSVIKEV